jgi:hypothetical protein
VETDPPSRPPNFTEAVNAYLKARGYELVFLTTGLRCEGRNNWYKHVNFKPSSRPGLNHQCYRGLERSHFCNMTACNSSWRTYDTTDVAEVQLAQQLQQHQQQQAPTTSLPTLAAIASTSLPISGLQAQQSANLVLPHGNVNTKTPIDRTNLVYPAWVVNVPSSFRGDATVAGPNNVRENAVAMRTFESFAQELLGLGFPSSDGESVDSLEHFFWGIQGGIAIELGALDGTRGRNSVTYGYEEKFEWRRILIEGNPEHKHSLKSKSPKAFSVSAAVCDNPDGSRTIDFVMAGYGGGIRDTLQNANPSKPVEKVPCAPMSKILYYAGVEHINLFILDVEVSSINISISSMKFVSSMLQPHIVYMHALFALH